MIENHVEYVNGAPLAMDTLPGPTDDFWYRPAPAMQANGTVKVTSDTAMRVSAVFACVRVISETLASLPLKIMRALPGGGSEPAPEHPLYDVLYGAPNQTQTSMEFREMQQAHICLRGNCYARIIEGRRRVIDALDPIHPDRVKVERLPNGKLRYKVRNQQGTEDTFVQDEIFRVSGLSLDGMLGLNPVDNSATTIGLAMSAEQHGRALFDNGGKPGGVVEHPGALSPTAKRNFLEDWAGYHGGPMNAGKTALLVEGMKYHELTGISNEALQYLETRNFQVEDICRLFRVPQHLVQKLDRSTNNNIEQQSLEFVMYTMLPWAIRWEQCIQRDLLTWEDKTYFAKFNFDGLLRGDALNRANALQMQWRCGKISVNEWRALDDQNPIPGGDRYFIPQEMAPADRVDDVVDAKVAPKPAPSIPPANPPKQQEADLKSIEATALPQQPSAAKIIIADAAERMASAIIKETEKRADKADQDRERFNAWASEWYRDKYFVKVLRPVVEAFCPATSVEAMVDRLATLLMNDLAGAEPAAVVESWKAGLTENIAHIINEGGLPNEATA